MKLFLFAFFAFALSVVPAFGQTDEFSYKYYKTRAEEKFALKDYVGALEDSITAINSISFAGDYKKDSTARNAAEKMLNSEVVLQTTRKYLKDDERIFYYYNQLFDALKDKIEISVNQDVQESIKRRQMIPKNPADENVVEFYTAAAHLEELMTDCAKLYVERGQPEKGIQLFQKIINLDLPNKYFRYSHRANFYIELKKYQAAIDDLTLALSGDDKVSPQGPDYILYLNKRGRLYEAVNQFDKAIADYETLKTVSPNNEKVMDEMIAKAKQKQMGKANQPK